MSPASRLFGVTIPFTPFAVVLAQVFVALPFYVARGRGRMRGIDRRSSTLARRSARAPWHVLTRVALPLAAPGIAPAPRWPGPAPSASSARRSPSPATSPARRRPPRSLVYIALEHDPQAADRAQPRHAGGAVAVLGVLRGRWLASDGRSVHRPASTRLAVARGTLDVDLTLRGGARRGRRRARAERLPARPPPSRRSPASLPSARGHVHVDGSPWVDADASHLDPSPAASACCWPTTCSSPTSRLRATSRSGRAPRGAGRRPSPSARRRRARRARRRGPRRPAARPRLSHGQAQRVALARALATDPRAAAPRRAPLGPGPRPPPAGARDARAPARAHTTRVDGARDPRPARRPHPRRPPRVRRGRDGSSRRARRRTSWTAPPQPLRRHVVGLNLYAGNATATDTVPPRSGRWSPPGTTTAAPSWVAFAPAAVALYPQPPRGLRRATPGRPTVAGGRARRAERARPARGRRRRARSSPR